MYGLISLGLGYAIYLVLFFKFKNRDFLSKEVTIILGIKLLLLCLIYFFFFSEKMTKPERSKKIEQLILTEKYKPWNWES